ncbi:MAG TPA: tetratricopeptide repeat protein [Gemmataceae bacterium]|jgi:serine/threonine protein kinase/Flp pilus assembly protein TadD|nr:tetratricopeptide repeat protein [Gemmataceae bacterium]
MTASVQTAEEHEYLVYGLVADEVKACFRAGRQPDIDALVAQHPEFAHQIRELVPTLAVMQQFGHAASGLEASQTTAAVESDVSGTLGDFRIVREIGRGGMGVVYEAEQISLRRRVALKVLPFAAALDAKQLQRFKNEAQAAAHLHHTNIVPVFGVGCERGVHFYAMQFIDGQTLAAMIAGLRAGPATPSPTPKDAATGPYQPTAPIAAASTEHSVRDPAFFRTVVTLGIQAAEALEHAHQLGVIHRDIKPANLLVDVRGKLWITDFGLAHCHSQAGLTMTGDLVGTLRYMSPEQALAKRVLVDQRTDVYSLGVTLYELLTLEPAYGGTDRQELLRQIAFEEPRRPRRVHKAIPPELETIVLKAIEKNPAERYDTAQHMADDLQRYLEDKPIRAKRPTLLHRARKWSRRHKALVWSVGVVLTLTAAVLAGSSIWYAQQQAAKRAETVRVVAVELAEAQTLLSEADKQTGEPERWQATVRLARLPVDRAEGQLATCPVPDELAAQVRQVRARVEEAAADSRVRVQLDRIWLAQATIFKAGHYDQSQAVPRYAAVLREYGVDLAVPEAAAARVRGSRVRDALVAALWDWRRLSQDNTEERQLAEVLRLIEPAPEEFRARWWTAAKRRDGATIKQLLADPAVRELPAMALVNLAWDLEGWKEFVAAERLLRDGRERYPRDFYLNVALGVALAKQGPPKADEAFAYFQAALALHGHDAVLHNNLGATLAFKGEWKGAIREFRASIELDPNYAYSHSNLGACLRATNDLEGAIREFQTAMRLDPKLAELHVNLGDALSAVNDLDGAIREQQTAIALDPRCCAAHHNLGLAFQAKHDLTKAIGEFQAAIKIDPKFAPSQNQLGAALRENGDLKGAIRHGQAAVQILPQDADLHTTLGIALAESSDLDGAIREFQLAVQLNPKNAHVHANLGTALAHKGDREGAVREQQTATLIDPSLADVYFKLGVNLMGLGQMDRAIAAFEAVIKIEPRNVDAYINLGTAIGGKGKVEAAIEKYQAAIEINPGYAPAHYRLAYALGFKRDLEGAIGEYQATIRIDPNHAEAHYNLGIIYGQQGRFAEALPSLKTAHRLSAKIKDWPHPSAESVRETERLVELDAKLPKVLSGEAQPKDGLEGAELANFCQVHKQLYAASFRLYSAAFAIDPKLADDLDGWHRYGAACAAALAGCGQGADAAKLTDQERASLRRQALDWLRADLAYHTKLADGGPAEVRAYVEKRLKHWVEDTDFAGVRGDALAKLPEAERQKWQQLWADVERTLRKATPKDTKRQ